jgi:hypothetical protein
MGEDQWRPGFVDYLFLAFNTGTAFSPTDVPVLSRWANILMLLQATISLGTMFQEGPQPAKERINCATSASGFELASSCTRQLG